MKLIIKLNITRDSSVKQPSEVSKTPKLPTLKEFFSKINQKSSKKA